MDAKFSVLAACLIAMMCLAGCGDGGSNFSGLGDLFDNDDTITTASLPQGAGSDSGSAGSGIVVNPEPATLGLLGSGLLAYALFKLKRKRQ